MEEIKKRFIRKIKIVSDGTHSSNTHVSLVTENGLESLGCVTGVAWSCTAPGRPTCTIDTVMTEVELEAALENTELKVTVVDLVTVAK